MREMGVEPMYRAWKARIFPLDHSRAGPNEGIDPPSLPPQGSVLRPVDQLGRILLLFTQLLKSFGPMLKFYENAVLILVMN